MRPANLHTPQAGFCFTSQEGQPHREPLFPQSSLSTMSMPAPTECLNLEGRLSEAGLENQGLRSNASSPVPGQVPRGYGGAP